MLTLQECITLIQFLEVFDGVDIDITQPSDLILDSGDILTQCLQVIILRVLQWYRVVIRQLILIPHIVDLILFRLRKLLLIAVQTINLFFQIGDLRQDLIVFLIKFFILLRKLFFLDIGFFQLLFQLRIILISGNDRLTDRFDIRFLLFDILFGMSHVL